MKSPVTYVIRNQLNGKTERVHADHIRLAKVDEWSIPKTATGQPRRRAAYVAPPPSDSDDDESEFPDSERETLKTS